MPETAKILIVDDTKANLVALRVLLKQVEADIISAGSGAEAGREGLALVLPRLLSSGNPINSKNKNKPLVAYLEPKKPRLTSTSQPELNSSTKF